MVKGNDWVVVIKKVVLFIGRFNFSQMLDIFAPRSFWSSTGNIYGSSPSVDECWLSPGKPRLKIGQFQIFVWNIILRYSYDLHSKETSESYRSRRQIVAAIRNTQLIMLCSCNKLQSDYSCGSFVISSLHEIFKTTYSIKFCALMLTDELTEMLSKKTFCHWMLQILSVFVLKRSPNHSQKKLSNFLNTVYLHGCIYITLYINQLPSINYTTCSVNT